jgi:hypothetical protein
MGVDIWEYFQTRDREVAEQSAAWDNALGSPYAEELGSNAQRGRIWGRLILTDSAFLQVHEVVQVRGSGITRLEYAYYLIYEDAELWAEERDPTMSQRSIATTDTTTGFRPVRSRSRMPSRRCGR